MPKHQISGNHPRRLGRRIRQLKRDLLPDEQQLIQRAQLAEVVDLNPPPVFGDTIVLASEANCASCPARLAEGDEATYIDGELNCTECTEEARRG